MVSSLMYIATPGWRVRKSASIPGRSSPASGMAPTLTRPRTRPASSSSSARASSTSARIRWAPALAENCDAGRFWVVETDGRVRGGIGVTRNSATRAQLRWFLLHPDLRGQGIGRDLVTRVVDYAREGGFGSIFLTTIPQLTTAAHLYREAGFVKIREKPVAPWGGPGITQIYALGL